MNTFEFAGELPRFTELEADYEIVRELGRGGTAVVYLARERELGRMVAIKVIRAAYIEDAEAAARLVREARTVGGLQHPNIVVLYGTRRLRDRSLALIMQFVPGRTLKSEVQAVGPLPFRRVEQILTDIGGALAYAHRHRIVHRDIKPENIYIDEESQAARLSDFGIARSWDTDSGLTLPGTAIGTPAYMSPEQVDGGSLDGRSDLYSLGMIGYEMLTGTRPWAGESLFSIIYKQKNEYLPPLDSVRPGIPAALQRAVEGALRKEPADRWADADSFLAALRGGRPAPVVLPQTPDDGVAPAIDGPQDLAVDDGHTLQYRRPAGAPVVMPGPVAVPAAARPADRDTADEEDAPDWSTDGEIRPGYRAALVALLILALVSVAVVVAPWTDAPSPAASAQVSAATGQVPAATTDSPYADAAAPGRAVPAMAFALLGAEQEGHLGDPLPMPLIVRVEDAAGLPLAGVDIRFRIASGEGTLAPSEAVTDSAGTATARWVLLGPGEHRAEAVVESLAGFPATFTARAVPRGPARLVALSPTTQAGSGSMPASSPLRVRVEDDTGNPVSNVPIRFAVQGGDGTVQPATGVTDSAGTAEATWVFGTSGVQQASARIVNVPNTTVAFRAGTAGPAPLPVRGGLVAGGTHTCSLGGDGSLVCWGGNDRGQLGDGTTARREAAARVAAQEQFAAVAAGVSHTCAVSRAASAYCWGNNAAGQLGDGTQSSRNRPGRVESDERLTSIAVGSSHSCAIAASGALLCWGDNAYGQLGDGSRTSRSAPVRAGGNRRFRAVALGWTHTCGIDTDGAAYCWGRNAGGQLGTGVTADRPDPAAVAGGHRFTALTAGSGHTCGIRGDGALLCWGQNSHGQLGSGAASTTPVAVPGDVEYAAVAAGALHTCGLTRTGTALCWGRNVHGQLGDGTTEDRSLPVTVAGGLSFNTIAASGAHSCGNVAGRGWHCWGYNMEGQLGDGTRENQLRPNPVSRR